MLLSKRSIELKVYLTVSLWLITLLLYFLGLIPPLNAILVGILSLGLYCVSENKFATWGVNHVIWVLSIIVGFFVATYRPSSFNYPLVWQESSLYPGGESYSLFVNTSKAIGGYLVIVWLFSKYHALREALDIRRSIFIVVAGVTCMLAIANIFFNIGVQFKLPSGVILFIIFNLGVTVISEEAFFRILLQEKIASFFKNIFISKVFSVSVVSLIFALSHSPQIGNAFFLYLIAGGIYATVYTISQRFSAAIAVHFGVNILHFLLLQYPVPRSLG